MSPDSGKHLSQVFWNGILQYTMFPEESTTTMGCPTEHSDQQKLVFSNFESIKSLFFLDLSWHTYVIWSYKLRHKSFTFTFTQSSLIFYYGPCQMTKPEIISQMISGIPIKICLWTLSYWQYTFSRVSWKCHQNPLWKAHSEFYLIVSGSLGLE